MGAKPTWFYRHTVVTVVACGLLGTSVRIVFAAASPPEPSTPSRCCGGSGFLAISGAGVLIGVLVGSVACGFFLT
jgi:hypothetical protein